MKLIIQNIKIVIDGKGYQKSYLLDDVLELVVVDAKLFETRKTHRILDYLFFVIVNMKLFTCSCCSAC